MLCRLLFIQRSTTSKDKGISLVDILTIITPVVSTFIAFYLGKKQALEMLALTQRQSVIEKQITNSNELVFEFIRACKEFEIIRNSYKSEIRGETNPIKRLFLTRFNVTNEFDISINMNQMGFINKFKKVLGDDELYGISIFSDICTLISNVRLAKKAYQSKEEVSKRAHEIFKENANGLGMQNITAEVDIHELWHLLYVNESFFHILDRVYFASLDFITSYPSIAKKYFLNLNVKTGEEPIKSATLSFDDIEFFKPITKPDWSTVVNELKEEERILQASFPDSDYGVYLKEYEEYIHKFSERNKIE